MAGLHPPQMARSRAYLVWGNDKSTLTNYLNNVAQTEIAFPVVRVND